MVNEKKGDKKTAENKSAEVQAVAVKRHKKLLQHAYLLNQTTCERYELDTAVSRIGRARSNTISLREDRHISRHHAWIIQSRGHFYVEDLGSTNGTLLNGTPVKDRSQISAGDRLTFGETELIFFAEK